jgi:copper oxidase (laccase) domain-containing protein
MGRRRNSRKAGQRGSSTHHKTDEEGAGKGALRAPLVHSVVGEKPVPGVIPRFEIPGWRERFGVVAGITGRGSERGRGFDLGLWSKEPVGEVMNRWLAFRREMEFPAIALGNQVHGVEVMTLNRGLGWIYIDGIDGWITTRPGILLTVTIADCVPIYLVIPGHGLALLHAGWRGIAGGILERGLAGLVEATGSPPADVVMHCGIGICGDCYEVGPEVLTGCGISADGPGPWHLDLRDHLVKRACTLGLTQVTSSSWCAAHHGSDFYSHRASKGRGGRMVAYLGMRPRLAPNPLPE